MPNIYSGLPLSHSIYSL